MLDEYPCEPFTDVYFLKYKQIDSARAAKRKLDKWYFFSRQLHVCYAPEYELQIETREKLMQRQEIIAFKGRENSESLMVHDGRPVDTCKEIMVSLLIIAVEPLHSGHHWDCSK